MESTEGVEAVALLDWADGTNPSPEGRPAPEYGWDVRHLSRFRTGPHLLGLQGKLRTWNTVPDRVPSHDAGSQGQQQVARLEAAGEAADAACEEIVRMPFAGRRETEVAADLAGLLRRFEHEQVDFTVVGSGPNGANPHHEAGERVIEEGTPSSLISGAS